MKKEEKNTAIYIAYDDNEPFDHSQPEKSLLKAIVINALADLRRPGEPNRRAMEYFLSPEEDYLFSFRSICSFLDVDADKVLRVIGLRKPDTHDEATRANRATVQ